MDELVLGALAIGDVVQVDHDALDVGLAEQVDRSGRHPDVAAVGPRDARLAGEHDAGSEEGLVEQGPGVDVGRRQEVERAMPTCLLAGIAEQRGEVRSVVHDAAVGVEDEHRVGRVRRERAVQPLARDQTGLGAVAELEQSHRPGAGERHERERARQERDGVGVVALDVGRPLDESGHEERHDRQDDPRRPGLGAYLDAFGRDALGFRNSAAAGGEQGGACHPPDVEQHTDEALRSDDQEREVGDQPQRRRQRRGTSPSSNWYATRRGS